MGIFRNHSRDSSAERRGLDELQRIGIGWHAVRPQTSRNYRGRRKFELDGSVLCGHCAIRRAISHTFLKEHSLFVYRKPRRKAGACSPAFALSASRTRTVKRERKSWGFVIYSCVGWFSAKARTNPHPFLKCRKGGLQKGTSRSNLGIGFSGAPSLALFAKHVAQPLRSARVGLAR